MLIFSIRKIRKKSTTVRHLKKPLNLCSFATLNLKRKRNELQKTRKDQF
jgi:hypothetical protein